MKFRCELKKTVDDSYDIEIGRELGKRLADDLASHELVNCKKLAVVTDSIVEELYAKEICDLLRAKGFEVRMFVIPEGEKSKTRAMKEYVEDSMLEAGFRRDCAVVAVGGGVVTDLAGFVAGTFGRGVPFVNYATTLLAAADASVAAEASAASEPSAAAGTSAAAELSAAAEASIAAKLSAASETCPVIL